MKTYYDISRDAIICVKENATSEMWDNQWLSYSDSELKKIVLESKTSMVSKITSKYLKPDFGLILEGGCGLGQHVSALDSNGFNVLGVDYAVKTVKLLNKIAPNLNIKFGDVKHLFLEDNSVAGYWSLGVIEHFWDGYSEISNEMLRVIKPEGFLFITHPYISPLRRLKILFKNYSVFNESNEPQKFYQFILNHNLTIKNFEHLGFKFCKFEKLAGLKGVKDEISCLKVPLQKFYDMKSNNLIVKLILFSLNKILTVFGGHSCLLIFQKIK